MLKRMLITAVVVWVANMGSQQAQAQALKAAISLPKKNSTDPIRIGFICPFSGSSQDFGDSARLGAELAVKEINEVGGYLGRPIELLARDDQANPDVGRRVAEELVLKDKVDFTVGFCNTGVALKSLDFFEAQQHLLLIPVATGSVLTAKTPAADSFVFRLSARDTLQAAILVEENRALRALLGETGEDADLRISALQAENNRLRAALIAAQAAAEAAGDNARQDAIWAELMASTERRKLSTAPV